MAGFKNNTGSGAGVTTFNTRSGAVTAANGDYTVSQVTGAAPLASPALTGAPTAPTATAGTNTTQLATTAFVTGGIATAVSALAPLASPALTGAPTAPTAAPATNTTQIATTAFVQAALVVPANGYGITGNTGSTPTPAVSLTSLTAAAVAGAALSTSFQNIANLSLAAGTWLVWGKVIVSAGAMGATPGLLTVILSPTSASAVGVYDEADYQLQISTGGQEVTLNVMAKITLASTGTVYLEGTSTTTTGGPQWIDGNYGTGAVALMALRVA